MKVGVLMGGISTEREISLKSGEGIVASIDREKYDVVPVVIDSKDDVINKVRDLDFAFLALHGKFGEDGSVQSVLETLEIPYSGCGPMTSAICMDKDMTKKVLKASEIRTARWTMAKSIDDIKEGLNRLIDLSNSFSEKPKPLSTPLIKLLKLYPSASSNCSLILE